MYCIVISLVYRMAGYIDVDHEITWSAWEEYIHVVQHHNFISLSLLVGARLGVIVVTSRCQEVNIISVELQRRPSTQLRNQELTAAEISHKYYIVIQAVV